MFPYYLLPGNKPKPKPKPKKPSSYLPSYLTVYVKPDPPPARAGIPDDILPFVNPNPKPVSQPKRRQYDPLSSIQAPKRGSGNDRSSSSRVSQRERTVRIRVGENSGPREIIPDKPLPDIADVPDGGIDPADLKFYFAARDHDLVRSVEAALTHEGLPARYYTEPSNFVRDNFAEYGMDDEADAVAVEYTRKYAEEMSLQRAQEVTQEVIEDLSNDELESVVAVDRDTGEIIFVRYGDEDSVTLQEEQRKLAEGRNIILIHNHPKSAAASLADLGAADWLDAERLVVVTPSGKRYYYHRRGGRLVALKPVQGPGVVAERDPEETAVARLLHMMQSAREAGNPAEWVMRQDEQSVKIMVTGTVQWSTEEEPVILDEGAYGDILYEHANSFKVLGKSRFNAFVVLVETVAGQQLWLDLNEHDAVFEFIGADNLADIPYTEQSAAILDNPYENTIEGEVDFLPIAQEDIDRVIKFGATGNPAWESTGGYHPGFDIMAEAGTEVRAITSGEVVGIFVPEDVNLEHVYGSAKASNVAKGEPPGEIYDPQTASVPARQAFADDWIIERDHRAYVIVRSGNAYIIYGHLDPDSIQVGSHVVAGQTIGAVGEDPQHENDHLHFELKTHGQTAVLLDENGEYVRDSKDHRPQFFLNPLYLFTAEERERIIAEYGLAPLDDQLLAIQGSTAIDHSSHGVGFYWRDRTYISRADGDA